MFTEEVQLGIVALGALLAFIGWVWMVRRAFGVSRGWAVVALIPVVSIVFVLAKFRRAAAPVGVSLIGFAIASVPTILNVSGATVDLGPRNKIVDGERHITLTGWDQTDYGILEQFPDTVVLQMANPDVTDGTLSHLRGMTQLRELDLNDTKITDAGLDTLAALPNLQVLKIARTTITPDAVQEKLLKFPSLKELDVRGLTVPTKVLREWRNADPMHRKYAN